VFFLKFGVVGFSNGRIIKFLLNKSMKLFLNNFFMNLDFFQLISGGDLIFR